MKSMTVPECIDAMVRYFGDWENPVVLGEVSEELSRYADHEVYEIYRQILRGRPAKFGAPDVVSVGEAIEAASKRHTLELRSGEKANAKKCPIPGCGNTYTGYSCLRCGFEPGIDVREHAAWYAEFRAGRAPRLNMEQIISEVVYKASVRRFDHEKQSNHQN